MSRNASYTHVFSLPYGRSAVFELFSDPLYLDRLTPGWFRLLPIGPVPAGLRLDSRIDYRLRWRGLPLRWTSRITDWDPPGYFAYEQQRGPYRSFRHEHYFEEIPSGTRVRDHVVFRGPAGGFVDRWIARPDLRRIFAFRQRRALELMPLLADAPQPNSGGGRTQSHEPQQAPGHWSDGIHRRPVGSAPPRSGLPGPLSGA